MSEEPRIEVYAPRRQLYVLLAAGVLMLWFGAQNLIHFLSQGFSGSTPHTLLLAFGGTLMGGIFVASSIWRVASPHPIVVVDSKGVSYRWLGFRRHRMLLEEVERLVVFEFHGVRYIGLVGLADIGPPTRPRPLFCSGRGMGEIVGEPIAFTIPDTILGSRFDETVSLIHEITGCQIVRK